MTVAKAIVQAWSDPTYKAKLLSDPYTALAEHGINVPDGLTLNVLEDTADTLHVVLPEAPKGLSELSSNELEDIAAGAAGAATLVKSSW